HICVAGEQQLQSSPRIPLRGRGWSLGRSNTTGRERNHCPNVCKSLSIVKPLKFNVPINSSERSNFHKLLKHEANSSRAARNQNSSMATAYTILSSPLSQASTYITTSVTYVLDRIESGIEAVNTLLTLTTLIHNNGAAGIEFMVY
ncbi:Uncharacterized protein DBV15_08562, partial [Temnothorax longispinosus]